MTMLSLSSLTRRFGGRTALDAVDLVLEPGERVALLGHNGAGKTTLMKLVLGLDTPTAGRIEIAGQPPGSAVARALTAYLPENVSFHPALTGREQLRHFLRLRGADPAGADGLLDKVGLAEAARRRIGTYSKGMRQRVGLAQALIGRPRLMILDEPTSGLDPVSRRDFYALLDDLAAHGTAILLSSHALSEVEARTDRIVVLSRGRKVAEGPVGRLRAEAALPVVFHIRPLPGRLSDLAAAFPEARAEADMLVLTCPADRKLEIVERVAGIAGAVEDVDIQPPSLDDVYASISGRAA